jgi:hypothetical protein
MPTPEEQGSTSAIEVIVAPEKLEFLSQEISRRKPRAATMPALQDNKEPEELPNPRTRRRTAGFVYKEK